MRREPEVVVVGAGIMGLATAHALARRGRRVRVLEQYRVGHRRGSSHGASRIVRLAYPEVEWVRLAQEAFRGWRRVEADSGTALLELTGFLELEPVSGAALAECGVEFELVDAEGVARRWDVRVPTGSSVLLQPEAGIVRAELALRAFLEGAVRLGAELVEEAPVRSLDELAADSVVVTAGSWARELLADAGIALPVVATRQTVAYFRLAPDHRPMPAVVAPIRGKHGFYALADPVHGLKAGNHSSRRAADPREEAVPDAEIVEAVSAWVAERFPLADSAPAAVETCLYTNTPDERFVLERHGRIVVGSACSGHGFKFAPVVGARLADLAERAA